MILTHVASAENVEKVKQLTKALADAEAERNDGIGLNGMFLFP